MTMVAFPEKLFTLIHWFALDEGKTEIGVIEEWAQEHLEKRIHKPSGGGE